MYVFVQLQDMDRQADRQDVDRQTDRQTDTEKQVNRLTVRY